MSGPNLGGKKILHRRQMKFHPDEVRSKIQAIRLVDVLHQFIFSEVDKNGHKLADLSMAQVRAIDVLLKKVVPDLTRTLISADVNVRYVSELPPVLSRAEWLAKYANPEPPRIIDGTTNGGGNGENNGPATTPKGPSGTTIQ